MLPIRLILVRHGESEANLLLEQIKKKDPVNIDPEFFERHSHTWKLTDTGRAQAQIAGDWLKKTGYQFDLFYASQHIRAMETAELLNIPNAEWRLDYQLRERDWGIMDFVKPEDRSTGTYNSYFNAMRQSAFYNGPANGESMAQLVERLRSGIVESLHRQNPEATALLVTHGEVMWGFRMILERLLAHEFETLESSHEPHNKINNCQILEYSRIDPADPKHVLSHYGWMRSVCPWDETRSLKEWQAITRKNFDNQGLKKLIEQLKKR